MSQLNKDQIFTWLKEVSQIEPSPEAAGRTKRKIRDILIKEQNEYVKTGGNTRKVLFMVSVVKFAVAALIFIGFGFFAGRLSVPKPVDIRELQTALESSLKESLESSIEEDLSEEMNIRLESVVATNFNSLKEELRQQVHNDLAEFTAQTAIASRTLTERRFNELIDLIEAARQRDREQIEAALMQIRRQTTKFGTGLIALATQTDEALRTRKN